jgi:hypothetical protein
MAGGSGFWRELRVRRWAIDGCGREVERGGLWEDGKGECGSNTHKKWLGKGASTMSFVSDWCATGIEDC